MSDDAMDFAYGVLLFLLAAILVIAAMMDTADGVYPSAPTDDEVEIGTALVCDPECRELP